MNSCGLPTPTTRANLAITTKGITIGTHKAIDTNKAIGQGITIREIPDITKPKFRRFNHKDTESTEDELFTIP